MAAPRPGRFSDWLRSRSDGELGDLFATRPDLLHPVPADFARLASVANSRPSLQAAVDPLDLFALQVLRTIGTAQDAVPYAALADALGAPPPERLRATVDDLRARGLVLGDDPALRTPTELARLPLLPAEYGPSVGTALLDLPPQRVLDLLHDLGGDAVDQWQALPELERRFADPQQVRAVLAEVTPAAREALDRVAGSRGHGRVGDARREVTTATARSPIDELLSRALLVAQADDVVAIPFEVAVALPQTYREPPEVAYETRDADTVDRTCGLHAHAFVQAVEDLLEAWADEPPSRLRAGGLAVRDLRHAAGLLDLDVADTALVIETAYAAGLLGAGVAESEWLPTREYDTWRLRPLADRWTDLALAWLDTSRAAGLVGQRDERNKAVNALGAEVVHGGVKPLRAALLAGLAALPPRSAPDPAGLVARLGWDRPRSAGRWRRTLADWTLREAEQLGVTGQGALTPAGRELLTREEAAVAAVLAPLLPEPVDGVLLQPDLTAVAPGPLRPEVRGELRLLADVESTGGATVYRFSPASVRRGLDAGRTAGELREWLAEHSRTPVPQALSYLVDDVARRHGRLRAGSATSYLRADDEAVLGEILAHRRAGDLGLRRIAPTVLVSRLERTDLLDGLRDLGYAPVAESVTGDVVVTTRQARRATGAVRPYSGPVTNGVAPPSGHLVEQAVRVLRAGDRMLSHHHSEHTGTLDHLPRNPHGETLTALHDAIDASRPLWIGYANAEGRPSLRLIEPEAVIGGLVRAYDHLRDSRRTFSLHRITGFAELEGDPDG